MGSYYTIPKAIFYLLEEDYTSYMGAFHKIRDRA